jgi:hypothetical protein
MLTAARGIRAIAIFEEMCRRHPEIGQGVRQTLPDVIVELAPVTLHDELPAVHQVGTDGGVA